MPLIRDWRKISILGRREAPHPPLRGTSRALIPRISLLLESGKWINRFPGSILRWVNGHERTVLDLLDQHLMSVLVRVTVVVGETDLTHDAVPLSPFEHLADPLGASRLGRCLAHDDHRLVCRRGE